MNIHSIMGYKSLICLFILTSSSATALAAAASHSITGATTRSAHSIQALPAALRPVVYQTFAKDADEAYALNKQGCATLPKQRLKACFDGSGAHFSGAGSPLALQLLTWGRSGKLVAAEAVKPSIKGNRLSYVHGNLTEWWRVLPIGFEQGFTIAKRPSGRGKLMLVLAAQSPPSRAGGNPVEKGMPTPGRDTNSHWMQASAGMTENANTLGWGRLHYGQLVVTDARGRVIPATLKSKGGHILIAVNDRHAAYPLTVDPLVWLEQKVTANDAGLGDYFGCSVALHGTTALVGAYGATINGNKFQGAVYVFTKSDGSWTQTQKLTASDGMAGDLFGGAVAFNGMIALIGANAATVNGHYYQGAAYIFTKSGDTWTQTQKLTASDGARFGSSVALFGATALIGSPVTTVNGNFDAGAAFVFTESDGTWNQIAELVADDGAEFDRLGNSVSLATQSEAIVGAPDALGGAGAAYVFDAFQNWNQTQKLTLSNPTFYDSFGYAIAAEGKTAIITAPSKTVNGHQVQGAVYVFSEINGNWQNIQTLIASDNTGYDYFGSSVALKGNATVIGAACDSVPCQFPLGALYIFTDSNGIWNQTQKLTPSDGMTYDGFGGPSGALSFDGITIVTGARDANFGGYGGQGEAYFYDQSDLDLAVSAPQAVEQEQNYVTQTIATNNASAASPAVTATVTVPAAASFISAMASQGSCSENSGVVSCNFGAIDGNAGTATANVTLKATGNVGDTIENTASIAKATPPLTASAATTITEAGACPGGYSEYDGNLGAHQQAQIVSYQAPAGQENAILTAPAGFQLYVRTTIGGQQKLRRIPGNEIHRQAPAGTYTWGAKAGDNGGDYTLCIQHP